MWTLSPLSGSVQPPAATAWPPTLAFSVPAVPVHWGGLFAAAAELLVVTVTSFESTWPSLPLNLNVSAPVADAAYLTVGWAVSWSTTVAVRLVAGWVIVMWTLLPGVWWAEPPAYACAR